MKTNSRIAIIGTLEDVYGLVEDVSRWPEIVENVGDVKVLQVEGRKKVVEMAARGSALRLKMTCEQVPVPSERRIVFRYVKGITKGVEVEWTFDEVKLKNKGLVLVSVIHDFSGISSARAYLLDKYFLRARTETMLERLKETVEAGFLAKVLLLGESFGEDMDWASGAFFEGRLVTVKVY